MKYIALKEVENGEQMKKLVGDVFLDYLQGFVNCIPKLPLIHVKTQPKV
jgi:hypothetical protein